MRTCVHACVCYREQKLICEVMVMAALVVVAVMVYITWEIYTSTTVGGKRMKKYKGPKFDAESKRFFPPVTHYSSSNISLSVPRHV